MNTNKQTNIWLYDFKFDNHSPVFYLAIKQQSKDLKTPYPKARITQITGLAYM